MTTYWLGQNWQQDGGLMDHDVTNPGYIGFGTNFSMENINYRTNITLEHCEKLYANETEKLIKSEPNGFCNVSFDNILCWPPTPFNYTAEVKCFSEFLGIRYDDTQNATRSCSWNGSWTKSHYDNCTELDPFSSNVETQTNIYLIGYVISSVTLAIAIFIFTYFKELRCLRNIIHMNLMWSYLLTYCMWIIILIEMNFRDHMAVTCVFVVTLLHYFHITTFFWMFVEGLYLYILVVRTLTRESFKLRVYALIGWGTPLFFIILWAVIKSLLIQRGPGDPTDACSWFRDSDIDYVFQVPTILVLVINIIFMISIMIVLVTKLRSANTLEIQQYRKAVKALAVLIPLLGVTYAITIYAPVGILDMLRSALLSVQRTVIQLKRCWDKVKRSRKEELAAERRNLIVTGGGPSVNTEKKTPSNVDLAVPHLMYEVPNSYDSDGIFLKSKISATTSESENPIDVQNSVSCLGEAPSISALDCQPTYITLQNVSTVPALPVSQIETIGTPRIKKPSQKLVGQSERQKSVDMVMSARLKNAEAENMQALELHNIRMKIEEENLRTAKLKSSAAELQLQIVETELNIAKLKHDKELKK